MTTNRDAPGAPAVFPALTRRLLALPRKYFDPVYLGLETLDTRRPALFVGNHTLFGLVDVPLMIEHLDEKCGVKLRSLADHVHFALPGWRELVERHGAVEGTPENCAALMRAGESILVFPGGGREVMRRRGEAYRLIWKARTGFARLAIAHGYDIVPFACIGPDESWRIVVDANDVMRSRAWRWLAGRTGLDALTRGGDMIPPLARGLGPTALPRPQRFYFGFGRRIPTAALAGRADDDDAVWALREQVMAAVTAQVARLKKYRTRDRRRHWSALRRWLAPLDP